MRDKPPKYSDVSKGGSRHENQDDRDVLIPRSHRRPSVFISYARSDVDKVRELSARLKEDGFTPWLDEEELLPGQEWRSAIFDAMRRSDYILVCLSRNSTATPDNRASSLNREIRFALDIADEKSPTDFVLIPVRLDNETDVPLPLARYQWINLFEPDGYLHLRRALELGSPKRRVRSHLEAVEAARDLLLNDFGMDELRRLIFELPEARSFYLDLSPETSQRVLVSELLKHLENANAIPGLITWLRVNKPYLTDRYPSIEEAYRPKAVEGHIVSEALENPYIVGNPIQPSNRRVFLGRFDIATTILSELKKAHQRPSILLYGRRRMGKTSALLNIRQLARDPNLIYVYVSGQSARFHTNRDFCYYLVQAMKDALDADLGDHSFLTDRGFLERTAFDSNPLVTLSECFESFQLFLQDRGFYCLLAIDEYEELDSHLIKGESHDDAKHLTQQLLLEIRDVLQHRPRIAFLFAGTHYLRDLSGVDWSSIFINVRTLHVSFLSPRDSALLLTQPVPGLSYQSDQILETVLTMTGCQPLLLQAMASEIVTLLNFVGKKVVTREIVDEASKGVLRKQNTYFNYLWATECQQKLGKKVFRPLLQDNYSLDMHKVRHQDEAVRILVRREILRTEGDTIHLTMPLFGLWLKANEDIL
jgi:hypothetical protein